MMDKYARLSNKYREAISELASAAGWQEEQAGKVLAVILDASERKMRTVSEQRKAEQKFEKLEATRNLLKNYRRLKISIECGAEHTLKLLEDNEYQRLMELEESVQNQRLVSTALLTAGNRVLWTRLNAALDCFKEFCASDPSPRVQRQYRLVYERYMAVPEKPVEDVLELLGIERTRYFTGISEATKTICVILFGAESAEDIS